MESASFFAQKNGLEHYLDKPAELNDMILKLLILQETIQHEGARVKRRQCGDAGAIMIRRTAAGKFTAGCMGDRTYQYAVETALKAATATVPVFQRGRFVSMLRQMGVPGDRVSEYCGSVTISDDTHCIDQE